MVATAGAAWRNMCTWLPCLGEGVKEHTGYALVGLARACTMSHMTRLTLSPLATCQPPLHAQIKICHDMFEFSGVVDHFGLDPATLGNFFAAVASRYRDVPYHNFNHAVHVLHGTWMVGAVVKSSIVRSPASACRSCR